MSNEGQEFANNFNNYENTRFDFGIAMLMTLFSKENQDAISKKIKEQLIEVKTIDDSTSPIKGMVYANETDDIDKSRIFYIKHEADKVAYSWHMMVHELTHFIGKPDKETIESEITSNFDKSELGGTQIFDFNTNSEYGTFFNECGADLICEMAMTTSIECRETNPQIKSADDIIYTNNRYQKTDYDSLSTIARLMVVAMDNNFSNQSYDQMMHSDSGLIDRTVEMVNQETGQKIDMVPTNDYLYAMAGHGKHLEKQFDRYSGNGSYREMCTFLDGEIKALQSGKNHNVDKNKLKEQLLRMADMVNNKMYILQSNNCISQEQKDAFIGRFNLVFNQALQEYDIGALTPEDIKKTTQSMNRSKANKIQSVIQQLSQDLPQDNIINPNEYGKTTVQPEMSDGTYINESGEIIRPNGINNDVQINDNIPIFTPPTEESSVEQPIQSGNQNENKLTLKQKVAQFLQRNNLFMNLSFVDRFVHKQLDVLPPATQETRNINTRAVGRTRQDFMDSITNFGQYRNLPPIQRMSDPERIARMQRKMKENQQSNDDNERS